MQGHQLATVMGPEENRAILALVRRGRGRRRRLYLWLWLWLHPGLYLWLWLWLILLAMLDELFFFLIFLLLGVLLVGVLLVVVLILPCRFVLHPLLLSLGPSSFRQQPRLRDLGWGQ